MGSSPSKEQESDEKCQAELLIVKPQHFELKQTSDFSLKNYEQIPELNFKKLVAQMKHLSIVCQSDKMEYDVYVDVLYEWLKLMKHLGTCVSLGFQDLIHKNKCMESNRKIMEETFKLTDKDKSTYIMDFIQLEKSMGIEQLNGENYKDVCPNALKKRILKEWMVDHLKDYESTARTVQRGAWFFDFVEYILTDFCKNRDQPMVAICHDSYDDNLSKYHNWFLR